MNRKTNALSASILIAVMAAGAAFAVPPGLRRAEPIVCADNNELVVRGRFIVTAGDPALSTGLSPMDRRARGLTPSVD